MRIFPHLRTENDRLKAAHLIQLHPKATQLVDSELGDGTIRVTRGSVTLMIQSALNSVLGLLLFVILARLISKEDMGVYAALTSTYGIFVVVATFGLNGAAARFIPKLIAEGKSETASTVATTIIKTAIVSSLVASVAYLGLAPYFALFFAKSGVYADLFKLASVVVLTYGLSIIADGLINGVQEFNALAVIRVIGQIARITVTILLLLNGQGLAAILAGLVASSIFVSVLPIPFIKRHLKLSRDSYPLRQIVEFSIPLMGASLVQSISVYADIFVAMTYCVPAEVGGYNVAVTAAWVLPNIIMTSIAATLLPAMSRAYGKGGLRSVEEAGRKASRYIALIYVPAVLGFAALSQPIIWLMAGRGYPESVFPLAVISVFSIASGLATPFIIGLESIGKTAIVLRITVIALVVEFVAGLVAIPILGIIGAVLARSVLFVGTLVYTVFAARTFMRVSFDREAVWKSGLAGSIMAVSLVALQAVHASVLLLPLYVAAGAFVYLLSLKMLRGVDHQDLVVLERTLPKKLEWTVKHAKNFFLTERTSSPPASELREGHHCASPD